MRLSKVGLRRTPLQSIAWAFFFSETHFKLMVIEIAELAFCSLSATNRMDEHHLRLLLVTYCFTCDVQEVTGSLC
jgi:hypothetical protein